MEDDLEAQVCMLQSHMDGMITRAQKKRGHAEAFSGFGNAFVVAEFIARADRVYSR